MSPLPTRRETSAGGVVYRRRSDGIQVVLVGRPRRRLWALPKGTPRDGESLEQTALREVAEETGLDVALAETAGPIGTVSYWYTLPGQGVRVHKDVHHYLLEARGGDLELHDDEYDEAAWFDVSEAQRRMTFENERSIVEQAGRLIAQLAAGAEA